MRQLLVLMVCLTCCALVAGCGGDTKNPATVPVTGTVKLEGVEFEGALVTFTGESSTRPATGTTNADGKFTLMSFKEGDGAPPGEYTITITKYADAGTASAPEEVDTTKPDAMYGDGGPDTGSENELPTKYASTASTPLKETVKAEGDNNFTFDLTKD